MAGRKRMGGAITLFLSLVLAVLFSFLAMALQSARTAGSRYLFSLGAEAAAKSMFAAYDSLVWEEYRILMLTDQGKAERIGRECLDSYENGGTLFSLSFSSVRLTEAETFVQNGAAAWEEAAVSYMEGRLPAEFVSWLWEQSGLAEELDNMLAWLTDFGDFFAPIVELEQKLCGLEEQLEQGMEAFREANSLLASIREGAQSLAALAQGVGQDEEQGEANEEELRAAWVALQGLCGQIGENRLGWVGKLSPLAGQMSGMLAQLQGLQAELEAFVSDISGREDAAGLLSFSGISDYLASLTERTDFLEGLPDLLAGQISALESLGGLEFPAFDSLSPDEREAFLSSLLSALNVAGEAIWPEDLAQSLPQEEGGTAEDETNLRSLLNLRGWLERGILGLVLPEGASVSEARLSARLGRSQRETEAEGTLTAAYRNLLYGEYALRYTDSFTQADETGTADEAGLAGEAGLADEAGLAYETEYLIAGEESDQANLAAVASQLLLLRGAANLLYLMQDAESRNAVRTVAAGISALLGGFIPASLIMAFLMILWALGEGVCDVRALLAGDEVPFFKNASAWRLSFDSLLSLADQGFVRTREAEGMSYEEYLRFLLFPVPRTEKCYRTMELAQENIASVRAGFQIDRAVSRAGVEIRGQAAGREAGLVLTYGYGN